MIENVVAKYYADKFSVYGATAKGVDWNSNESQFLRFEQLARLFAHEDQYSVLDYGCGYGSLYQYLTSRRQGLQEYIGFDLVEEMLEAAKVNYGFKQEVKWLSDKTQLFPVDYVVASGIFNVKQDVSQDSWEHYMYETLHALDKLAVKGFGFNVLTSYSDADYMKDYLYYASPEKLFTYCMSNFGRRVAVCHDYPLYEFTILVRKDYA